jgi:hypothetical protein
MVRGPNGAWAVYTGEDGILSLLAGRYNLISSDPDPSADSQRIDLRLGIGWGEASTWSPLRCRCQRTAEM